METLEPVEPDAPAPDPPEPSGSVALGEEPQPTKQNASKTPVAEPRALFIAKILDRGV
ncbi:hypothetical protein WME76_40730 [Sorangium sp. So ce119]|uniref:hypothetical protein n=1 Tax=Sorangium sp. So ce119 TaxID=3133279 RepID=UPI003F609777